MSKAKPTSKRKVIKRVNGVLQSEGPKKKKGTEGSRPSFIYGLVDPRTGLIHYVGQTVDPETRLSGHRRESLEKNASNGRDHNEKKDQWFRDAEVDGLKITMKILETTVEELANALEIKWVSVFKKKMGPMLFNRTRGGFYIPKHKRRKRTSTKRQGRAPAKWVRNQ